MDAYQVLVIILSVTLAVFLILAIVATILLIKLFRKANNVADSLKRVAENVESFSDSMKNASGPINLIRMVASMFNKRPGRR